MNLKGLFKNTPVAFVFLLLCSAINNPLYAAPELKAKDTKAEHSIVDIARIYHASMTYLFKQQPLINATSGNKEKLFGKPFIEQVKATYFHMYRQDFPDESNLHIQHMIKQMMLVMEDNRTLLLDQDIGFKGFIPAIFAFQLSEKFKERGYGVNIKFTNFSERVRNQLSTPDDWEHKALTALSDRKATYVLDEESSYLGKNAIRYMRPVTMTPMCLSCHGEAKDNPANKTKNKTLWSDIDKTGFKMEGWKIGELGGGISVVIYQ